MKAFTYLHESFHNAVGKFSRSIGTVRGKKREGMGGRVQAREGRAHAHPYTSFRYFIVTLSRFLLIHLL